MLKNLSLRLFKVYPILFCLDAALSVLDDGTSYFVEKSPFNAFRSVFAYVVILLSIPYLFNLFFVTAKRKLLYLSMPLYHVIGGGLSIINLLNLVMETTLFTTLALSISPHSVYIKHPGYFIGQIALSLIQVAIGFYCLKNSRQEVVEVKEGKTRWFLAGLSSSLLLFLIVMNMIVTIPVLLIGSTKGFLGFDGSNITSIERIYNKADKTLHLIPMIHVGDEEFYKEVSKIDGRNKTLFLLEGVSDTKKLMANIDYTAIAKSAGLDTQKDHFNPVAPKELQKNISFKSADIDVEEFNPKTREFLNSTFKNFNDRSLFDNLFKNPEGLEKTDSAHLIIDLIEKRNAKLIKVLYENEKDFKEFYIPWGAMHLPEIERELLKSGYKLVDTKERAVISLSNVVNKIQEAQKKKAK